MTVMSELLLNWFDPSARCFPFRWQRDPYKILIAGVLLKKTSAKSVASVYPRFIERYPTPQILAKADADEVRHLIRPLGLTSRADDLIRVANIVVSEHCGIIPKSYEELVKLPSVGDYIASCVLTLGYGQSMPLIDVNVTRVLGRLYGINGKDIHRLYSKLNPAGGEDEFHYAILDLAHLICRPSEPKCEICPLADLCNYVKRLQ